MAKKAVKKSTNKVAQKNAKKAAKKTVTKVAKKTTKKVAKKAAKKVAKKAAKKTTKVAKKIAATKAMPTFQEIELKAYFIYMDRIEHSKPGNSQSDWVEAIAYLTK